MEDYYRDILGYFPDTPILIVSDELKGFLPKEFTQDAPIIIDNTIYQVYKIICNTTNIFLFFNITPIYDIINEEPKKINLTLTPTNIPQIDKQHKELLDLINIIQNQLTNNIPLKEIINNLLTLKQSTIEHFNTEEKLLTQIINTQYAKKHIKQHKELINQLNLLLGQLTTNNITKIINYLTTWLIKHTNEYDNQLQCQLQCQIL